ncbi:TPR repeat protein [Parvibaculum indicum]|uniref:hypothetical protein n=1 Tax=Parvibaculum indicum TaxID=562969 RepID=UPI0014238534|nr:hypothetical protein [Parvibaculum indicum]NIJ42327.1 TPR repeat protein [Parvibaculum indicum]
MLNKGNRLALTLIVLVAASLGVTACSDSPGSMRRTKDGKLVPTLAGQDPLGTLYASSVQKAERGDCNQETMDVLTCFAYRGHGYEGAQTALGQCLIRKGDEASGIQWIQRAANAGWADAQKTLALHYASDGADAPSAMVKGAFWARLYSRNASLLSLGVTPDPDVTDKYRGKLTTAQATTVLDRLNAWYPEYWTATSLPDQRVRASCQVESRPRARPDLDELRTVPNPY